MIEHGGNLEKLALAAGCPPEELLDFSVNLSPAGIPEGLFAVCFRALDELSPYPEQHAETLSRLAAEKWHLEPGNILFGNGSSELLSLFPRIVQTKRARIVTPGYLEYAGACRAAGLTGEEFRLRERGGFRLSTEELGKTLEAGDLVIFGNPNNPTGRMVPAEELHGFIRNHPEQTFLIDEAFADFFGETLLDFPLLKNAAILRSMTKYYSIAGLRLGYIAAPPEMISALREIQPPWSVGTVAFRAAEFLLTRPERKDGTALLREELAADMKSLGLKVYPSSANYLLLKAPRPLAKELLTLRIAVRDCSNYPGLDERYIRVAVRNREDNSRLSEAVRKLLVPEAPAIVMQKKRPALMLQGTCSNAGKSILTAAFCRILLQDGYAVAPFKAQNMALNSAVTPSGGEIGRAQAVQAEACRLDPDVRMNPILLKPNSDMGSQVILLGHPIGNYRVRDYFAKKKELWSEVRNAYDSLASEYDCIVLEGAGSPGEINLKSTDIVNMRMAEYAQSPVLLAGDIDRGGVYASFIGTYATLEPWERKLLHGFVVNKFRGDPTLLGDAHDYVRNMTGKPVLGVVDFLPDLGLPEEDSVNFGLFRKGKKDSRRLDIALIHLGHIANFTDVAPFEAEPDAELRTVRTAAELGEPDLVILPGSKGVADDLRRLREEGLFEAMRNTRAPIAGICGGLQMLGERLLDPDGVESSLPEVECLGLLPLETVMMPRKILRRTTALYSDGTSISGYEIHHGTTRCSDPLILRILDREGREVGYEKGNIFATYLHGVFDDDAFRRKYLNRLRKRKGWPELETGAPYGLEEALNRLADHVRARLDIPALYKRMGL